MTTCPSANFLVGGGGGGGEGFDLAWFESQCVFYESCVIFLSDYSRSLSCSEHFSMSSVYPYIVK